MTDLRLGDCIEVMRSLQDASVDAVVTDPPYGLGFMGHSWDQPYILISEREGVPSGQRRTHQPRPSGFDLEGSGAKEAGRYDLSRTANQSFQAWCEVWGIECLRVLKPGGHLVSFGGTRTYHRLTAGLEDAGFEIRDCLAWLFGSGFPKSLDVSKAIDKAEGHRRGRAGDIVSENRSMTAPNYERTEKGDPVTPAAAAAAAAAAAGLGTALKPAFEPIVLARKPFTGTVAGNWMEHGVGALHIDGARIKFSGEGDKAAAAAAMRLTADQNEGRHAYGRFENGAESLEPYLAKMEGGRWPANVLLDEDAAEMLDEQTGQSVSRIGKPGRSGTPGEGWGIGTATGAEYDDQGGASRFFYCAKTSRAERHAGCEQIETAVWTDGRATPADNPRLRGANERANNHPTVKPIDLMRWLTRLVTPKGGLILDPFLGSGTTGCAAVLNGHRFIGIEREPGYLTIAQARIRFWEKHGEDGLRICRERDAAERVHQERVSAGQLTLV